MIYKRFDRVILSNLVVLYLYNTRSLFFLFGVTFSDQTSYL